MGTMGDGATLGRADSLAALFSREVGVAPRVVASEGAMPQLPLGTSAGFQLGDLDGLLRRHEKVAFEQGYVEGGDDTLRHLREQHQIELGEFVGGAFSIVESEVLATIVGAAAKARDRKGSKKADIVQAVVDQVKREAAALGELAHRARTAGLFS